MSAGQIYNGEAIEKTVEDMTISLASAAIHSARYARAATATR